MKFKTKINAFSKVMTIGCLLGPLLTACSLNQGNLGIGEDTSQKANQDSDQDTIRALVTKHYPQNVYMGVTTGFDDWGSAVEDIQNREFNYITPNNDFKQTRIHPEPGVWRWEISDNWIKKARENDQVIRLHGPISPQSSKWVLADHRTPAELDGILVSFMTALSQRYNNSPEVKWMDVVNETITEEGEWFGPKPGINKWENPWPILGFERNIPDQFPLLQQKGVPLYIIKAFEIADKHAPNLSLILNQHRMTSPESIALVKELVLYLKHRGLRVDGIGWQAHLRKEWVNWVQPDSQPLQTLDGLVKWAHQHDLEFHVTENNIHIPKDKVPDPSINRVFSNIVQVLLENRETGVVAWNLWTLSDKPHFKEKRLTTLGLWDEQLKPKAAYQQIKTLLKQQATD